MSRQENAALKHDWQAEEVDNKPNLRLVRDEDGSESSRQKKSKPIETRKRTEKEWNLEYLDRLVTAYKMAVKIRDEKQADKYLYEAQELTKKIDPNKTAFEIIAEANADGAKIKSKSTNIDSTPSVIVDKKYQQEPEYQKIVQEKQAEKIDLLKKLDEIHTKGGGESKFGKIITKYEAETKQTEKARTSSEQPRLVDKEDLKKTVAQNLNASEAIVGSDTADDQVWSAYAKARGDVKLKKVESTTQQKLQSLKDEMESVGLNIKPDGTLNWWNARKLKKNEVLQDLWGKYEKLQNQLDEELDKNVAETPKEEAWFEEGKSEKYM